MNNINKIITNNSQHFFKESKSNNDNENLNDTNNKELTKSHNSFMT